MNATKIKFDADRGQYVQQIRHAVDGWIDFITLKSQSELDAAIRTAKCCGGMGDRPGAYRVVHKFMGTTVLADFTDPKFAP